MNLLRGESLSNTFASALYMIWGVPYLRFVNLCHQVMKRIYVLELESLHKTGVLLTST